MQATAPKIMTTIIALLIMAIPAFAEQEATVATVSVGLSVAPNAQVVISEDVPLSSVGLNQLAGSAFLRTAANFPYTVAVHWSNLYTPIASLLNLTGDFEDPDGEPILEHGAGVATGQLQVSVTLTGDETTGDGTGASASGTTEVFYMDGETREDVGTVQVTVTPQNGE